MGLCRGLAPALNGPLDWALKQVVNGKKDSNPCFKFDVAHTLPFNILRRNTVDKGCFRPLHILATQCVIKMSALVVLVELPVYTPVGNIIRAYQTAAYSLQPTLKNPVRHHSLLFRVAGN